MCQTLLKRSSLRGAGYCAHNKCRRVDHSQQIVHRQFPHLIFERKKKTASQRALQKCSEPDLVHATYETAHFRKF